MTSLRRLEHISKRRLFHNVSETSQIPLSKVFVVFQKYPTKMISCDFRRVITISDKIDPLETQEMKRFLGAVLDINQVCHEYQWADICLRVLVSQRSSKPSSRCIIYYF